MQKTFFGISYVSSAKKKLLYQILKKWLLLFETCKILSHPNNVVPDNEEDSLDVPTLIEFSDSSSDFTMDCPLSVLEWQNLRNRTQEQNSWPNSSTA